MARYKADQNKVLGVYESGTYGTIKDSGSTFWIGQVTDHSVDDQENPIETRYLGTATRNFDTMEQGPRDVTGTLTYNPQDMRLVGWAIGSVSPDSTAHVATEINSDVWQSPFTSGTGQLTAPISFTIEDSKQAPGTGQNFVRTVYGCVPNSTTITASQGEKVEVVMDYVGQTLIHTSGATSSVTESTVRPFLWSDCSLTVAGSTIDTAKEISLEINQNLEAPHYMNGSRDIAAPIPQNRDYTLNVTMDLDSNDAAMLYRQFYKGGSTFNAVFDMNNDVSAVGSQHAVFVMSGCYVTSMDNPSTNEGVVESTVEIRPESITGSFWDQTTKYNPF